MNVLVTGGAGFIGRRVVQALLERGTLPGPDGGEQPIERIRVNDVTVPALADDSRLESRSGDFSDAGVAESLLGDDTHVVFHLAAIVSGQAEQDFDLGMKINLDGTRRLLDACRRLPHRTRVLFASSVAAYGGDMPEIIHDGAQVTPQTSYGTQKAICELLLNDYSRKGFLDGRALRLPTIVVRPGKPNAAASSFASSIIREPLEGREYVCPVKPQTQMWILSPRAAVEAFVHVACLPEDTLGSFRAIAIPGMTVSVADMVDALGKVAGEAVVGRLRFEPDPFIEQIVYGWATRFEPKRGERLGFRRDASIEDVIQAFIDDDLGGRFVA